MPKKFDRHALPPRLTRDMCDEELNLHSAVWFCPWDESARGVYSDWLGEHDRTAEAALHRTVRAGSNANDALAIERRMEYHEALRGAGMDEAADFVYAQLVLDRLPRYVELPNAWEAHVPGQDKPPETFRVPLDSVSEDVRLRYKPIRDALANIDKYQAWVSDLTERMGGWNGSFAPLVGRARVTRAAVYSGGSPVVPTPEAAEDQRRREEYAGPRVRTQVGFHGFSVHPLWKWGMLEGFDKITWEDWATSWRNVMYWEPVRYVKLASYPRLQRAYVPRDREYHYTLRPLGRYLETLPKEPAVFRVSAREELIGNPPHRAARLLTDRFVHLMNIVTRLLRDTWPTVQWDMATLLKERPIEVTEVG